MPEYDFSQVEVFIVDPQNHTQRLLRDVLSRIGLKRSQVFNTVDEAMPALKTALVDLLLVDAPDVESDAFRLIRSLRHEQASLNPFLGLLVTTWAPTQQLLLKVANSGVDDLIVKPVSPKQMQDRVLALVEGRKKFVVTSDFVGPDRRKAPREGTVIPLIDAPNTLRLKAVGQWDRLDPAELINRSWQQINQQKLIRSSVQVAFLVEFAIPGLLKPAPDRMSLDHVARLPGVVDDLLRRCPAGPGKERLGQIGATLNDLAGRIRERPGQPADKAELTQLRNLAYGLMRTITPDRSQEAMIKEVGDAVAGYRARLDQLAAQKAAQAAAAQASVSPATTDDAAMAGGGGDGGGGVPADAPVAG